MLYCAIQRSFVAEDCIRIDGYPYAFHNEVKDNLDSINIRCHCISNKS